MRVMSSKEFHEHSKQSGIYYMPERVDSDFFQRFLLKHTALRDQLICFLETHNILHTTVELRQNAEDHMDIIVVVQNRIHQHIMKSTSLDSPLL